LLGHWRLLLGVGFMLEGMKLVLGGGLGWMVLVLDRLIWFGFQAFLSFSLLMRTDTLVN
jgi:hypothetical protein